MNIFTAHICVRRPDFSGSLDVIEEKNFSTYKAAASYVENRKKELETPYKEWECFVNEYDLTKPQGHQRVGKGVKV